jgi:hypothetical protein
MGRYPNFILEYLERFMNNILKPNFLGRGVKAPMAVVAINAIKNRKPGLEK